MGSERKSEEGLETNEWTCKQTDSQDQSHKGKDEDGAQRTTEWEEITLGIEREKQIILSH